MTASKLPIIYWASPFLLWAIAGRMYLEQSRNSGGPDNGYLEMISTAAVGMCFFSFFHLWSRQKHDEYRAAFLINAIVSCSLGVLFAVDLAELFTCTYTLTYTYTRLSSGGVSVG